MPYPGQLKTSFCSHLTVTSQNGGIRSFPAEFRFLTGFQELLYRVRNILWRIVGCGCWLQLDTRRSRRDRWLRLLVDPKRIFDRFSCLNKKVMAHSFMSLSFFPSPRERLTHFPLTSAACRLYDPYPCEYAAAEPEQLAVIIVVLKTAPHIFRNRMEGKREEQKEGGRVACPGRHPPSNGPEEGSGG